MRGAYRLFGKTSEETSHTAWGSSVLQSHPTCHPGYKHEAPQSLSHLSQKTKCNPLPYTRARAHTHTHTHTLLPEVAVPSHAAASCWSYPLPKSCTDISLEEPRLYLEPGGKRNSRMQFLAFQPLQSKKAAKKDQNLCGMSQCSGAPMDAVKGRFSNYVLGNPKIWPTQLKAAREGKRPSRQDFLWSKHHVDLVTCWAGPWLLV